MMIDTSAMVALLFEEPEAPLIRRAIAEDPVRLMSALTWLELSMVVEARRGAEAVEELEALLVDLHVEVHAFDATLARRALLAWRRFGKGRHPAGLNLGDLCSFAAAMDRSEPLLYKGDDFPKTGCPLVVLKQS